MYWWVAKGTDPVGGSPATALNPRVPCPVWSLLLSFPSRWCEMMLISNRHELLKGKKKKVLFLSNRNLCNQSCGCKMRVIVTIIAIQMWPSSLNSSVLKKPQINKEKNNSTTCECILRTNPQIGKFFWIS